MSRQHLEIRKHPIRQDEQVAHAERERDGVAAFDGHRDGAQLPRPWGQAQASRRDLHARIVCGSAGGRQRGLQQVDVIQLCRRGTRPPVPELTVGGG